MTEPRHNLSQSLKHARTHAKHGASLDRSVVRNKLKPLPSASSGFVHIQGFIPLKEMKPLCVMKDAFFQCDWIYLEPMKGKLDDAVAYCMKRSTKMLRTNPVI